MLIESCILQRLYFDVCNIDFFRPIEIHFLGNNKVIFSLLQLSNPTSEMTMNVHIQRGNACHSVIM